VLISAQIGPAQGSRGAVAIRSSPADDTRYIGTRKRDEVGTDMTSTK
jgi:hypothetical protein